MDTFVKDDDVILLCSGELFSEFDMKYGRFLEKSIPGVSSEVLKKVFQGRKIGSSLSLAPNESLSRSWGSSRFKKFGNLLEYSVVRVVRKSDHQEVLWNEKFERLEQRRIEQERQKAQDHKNFLDGLNKRYEEQEAKRIQGAEKQKIKEELNQQEQNLSSDHIFKIIHINWDPLAPQGDWARLNTEQELNKFPVEKRTPEIASRIQETLEYLEFLKPTASIETSKGKFRGYFGLLFASGMVIFENLKYGNATYIFRSNWVEASQKSKQEALKMGAQRVPHLRNWKEKLKHKSEKFRSEK